MPEEDFDDAVHCTQYHPDDEMGQEDVQDTQFGPHLILVGTSGQSKMTNFSLPTPQIVSLYVATGRSSLVKIQKRKVVLPAFFSENGLKAPNTIMAQALGLLDGSLPPDAQTTGVR